MSHSPPPPRSLAEAALACEREPVHAPGAIQPHGGLLALSADGRRVEWASANLAEILGVTPQAALATAPEALLGASLLDRLRKALEDPHRPPALVIRWRRGAEGRRLHLVPYRSAGRILVEIEPVDGRADRWLLAAVTDWQARLPRLTTSQALFAALTEHLRALTGHERVMIYRFDEQWHGSVVAESRAEGVESFLHHHFPASDIPAQVRALYDRQPVRSFPDVAAPSVPLVGSEAGAATLDLAPGYLRAIAPVHREYLGNMGVGAALSVALHVDRRLWGLVSCHSRAPRPLSPALRDTLNAIVQASAIWLGQLHAREEAELLARLRTSRYLLSGQPDRLPGPEELLARHGREWLELFDACGVALCWQEGCHGLGRLPEAGALAAMAAWLEHHGGGVWQTQSLGQTPLSAWREDTALCGLLAVPLLRTMPEPGWLLLFRQEQREERLWAGRPQKDLMGADGRLGPRRSFAGWQEQIRGRSRVWREIEIGAAEALAEDLAVAAAGHAIGRLNQRLARLACSDHLTGTWSRYRMAQAIDAELGAAERYGRPCALLLFDVDHFKRFNDTQGHEAGDRVLVELVRAVEAELRESDSLGRWGGEEFIVLATHTDLAGGVTLAERLRRRVARLDFGELGRVTVSVGVAARRPGDDCRTLVGRADAAMYRAKAAGRDRVGCEEHDR